MVDLFQFGYEKGFAGIILEGRSAWEKDCKPQNSKLIGELFVGV